jgi:hypothetical protein
MYPSCLNQFSISIRVIAPNTIFNATYNSSKDLPYTFSKQILPSTTKAQLDLNQENKPAKTKQKPRTHR